MLVDRVKIFVTSSGTAPFTLGSKVPGFRGVEALTDGDTYSYAVESGADFEVGTGLYLAGTATLTRSPVRSSNGDGLVLFPPEVQIAFVALAQDISAAAAETALRADLLADGGASIVGTDSGDTVQEALDAKQTALLPGVNITIDNSDPDAPVISSSNPGGTVTSVAALTLGTTGNDLSSSVATGTTTPVITLNVPTASASARGALASSDFTAFAAKVGPGAVTGSGLTMATAKLLGRWTASTGAIQEVTIGSGLFLDGSGNLTVPSAGGGAVWGSIVGTLSAQTDLQTALNGKASTGAVGSSGITMATGKLLGRWSASTGAIQEVTISTGLALDGSGNLTCTVTAPVSSVAGKTGAVTLGIGDIAGATTARLFGRYSAGTGIGQEITIGAGLALSGAGVLSATSDIEVGSPTIVLQDSAGNSATMGANNVFRFVRIGKFVLVSGTLHWTATTALTTGSRLRLSGLPYAATNTAQYRAPAIIGAAASGSFSIASDKVGGAVDFNSTAILLSRISNQQLDANLVKTDIGGAGTVYGVQLSYQID